MIARMGTNESATVINYLGVKCCKNNFGNTSLVKTIYGDGTEQQK